MRCDQVPASFITTDRAAMNAVEAIVFREILKPLASGLGPVGDVAIGSVADAIFAQPKK